MVRHRSYVNRKAQAMDSRRKAESADVRARQLSRRVVLTGGSAASLVAVAPAATTDPSVAICQLWLAIDAEQRPLELEWGALEGWLITESKWFKLAAGQRAAIPEGARLAEIDAVVEAAGFEASDHEGAA